MGFFIKSQLVCDKTRGLDARGFPKSHNLFVTKPEGSMPEFSHKFKLDLYNGLFFPKALL